MKKILFFTASLFLGLASNAQVGATAPDFTVTDINGNSHHLYEYLNAGKVVVLDVSAVWCGPCWSFHQAHYLETLYNDIGQGGTNQAVILFYEADPNTDNASLSGTGGNTLGNWLNGSSYPFINESPISIDLNIYAQQGFPTINVISPQDKKIKSDLFNMNNVGDMKTEILSHVSTASVEENVVSEAGVSVYPNPSNGQITLNLNAINSKDVVINVFAMDGKVVRSINSSLVQGENKVPVNLDDINSGHYFIKIEDEENNYKPVKVQVL